MEEQAEVTPSEAKPKVKLPSKCYACGSSLPEGSTVCPRCGRRQVRLCYCGNYIPVTASTCPYCGADWSRALRVRRKSRSKKLSWKFLIAYASAGALIAIACAALVNSIIGGLAIRSLPPGQTGLPASFTARLALAMETIGRTFSQIGSKISSVGGGPGTILLIFFAGAATGALVYLHQAGQLKIRLPFGSKKKVKRRRRRAA